ncbi:hypothetical protein [Flavobacterium sp.]|uniref:hypothetical protein n=1 Tax=Flavobacterium sp. TaxID=239 RepID=UPI00260CE2BC|nr:hypothetical protein [Flavobacterium sp.]
MSIENYEVTRKMLILTPIFLFISILLGGNGHGYFFPIFVLFPTATFTCIWMMKLTVINLILAVFQFPAYGIIIDKTSNKKRTIISLFIIHVMLTILILKFADENWK